MFKFLRKTSLYILAIPVLIFGLGCLSNQIVLWANHDKFPVMWNTYKVAAEATDLAEATRSKDKDVAKQAAFDLEALLSLGYIDDTHVVMTSKTHLNFLADVVDLKSATYSVGDGLLILGEWLMTLSPFIFFFEVNRKLRA
jgi:hypothetical protein